MERKNVGAADGGVSPESRSELGTTGIQVSPIGFGASTLGNEFGLVSEESGIHAVHEALRRGINFFDVSPYYGRTRAETVLGKALRGIPRDSYVLGTKVGRYDTDKFDFSAERVTQSVQESMERLGVEHLDIIHCHDIEFAKDIDQIATETIPALNKLKAEGKVKAIGITGYPLEVFPYVLSCAEPGSIDVVLSYCNYCLQNDRLSLMLDGLKRHGVGVVNASALSMGMLTPKGPPEWHPADKDTKEAAKKASAYCNSRGSDLATVALQYAMRSRSGRIASTLVGIDSVGTLKKNLALLSSEPDWDLIHDVQDIFKDVHNRRWDSGHYLGYQG